MDFMPFTVLDTIIGIGKREETRHALGKCFMVATQID
jgi:hypothetical protein